MISKEQVADLQPGDVVELTDDRWPLGTVLRGPVWLDEETGYLRCGPSYVRHVSGDHLPSMTEDQRVHRSITVVSRAPRPLYVNHPRTDVWPGDVVRDAERAGPTVWMADRNGGWWLASMGTVRLKERHDLPARLILLVDGETGQVVQ